MENLLSAKECSTFLGLSLRSVYRLTDEGVIPCVRIGTRTIRYRPADLSAWLDSTAAVSA